MIAGRVTVGHPVDVGSGAVFTLSTDFRIPGSIVLGWRRHYSTVATSDTWLGPKWTVPYFMRLERRSDRYVLSGSHGEEVSFDAATGPLQVGAKLTNLGANMELHRGPGQFRVLHWHTGGNVSWFCFNARDDERMPLAAIENLSGHRLRVDYDKMGRPARLVQELERRTVEISYGGRNLIAAVHFLAGTKRKLQVQYEYDARRRLIAVLDALGHRKGYEYDADNRMTVESNPLGSRFVFQYDRLGRCTRTAGEDGFFERKLQYFTAPKMTRVTDSLGSATAYYLNPAGQVVQIVDPFGGATTNTFDEHGRLIAVMHPDGAKESYAYDDQGNRAEAVDPCGAATTVYHNERHVPIATVDRNGNGWNLANRNEGSLLGVENLPPQTWTYTRDARGLVIRAQSPGGWVIHVRRDEHFRWQENHDQYALLARTEFDEFGYPTLVRDAEGVVTRTRYDDLHRKVEVTRGSEVTRYRWNAVGRMTERTGPGDQHDVWHYDQYGYLVARTNALRDTTRQEYDNKEGNVTAITNRAGERLEYRRDALGRIVEEKLFDGRVQRYEYDLAGRQVKIHLADGRTVSQRFDAAGRLLCREASDGLVEEFAYDKESREIKAWNNQATVELKRDRFGNILEEIQNGRSLRYRYDVDNNRTGRLLPLGPPGGRLIRTFDIRGQLTTLGDERGQYQVFSWDHLDRLLERRCPGRLIERFTYDGERRLHEHEVQVRSGRLARIHTYDANGNLAALEDKQSGTFRYVYDRLDRLREVHKDGSLTEVYDYDANDAVRATHRGLRRLGAGGKTADDGSRELSYGADGSVSEIRTGRSARSFKHDVNGRLVEVAQPDGTVIRYEYDPFGRRTAKVIGEDRTEYLWEVWELAAEVRDGKLQGIYAAAADLRPLAQWQGERLLTPILDLRGAVREVFDESGQMRWSCELDAYGNLLSETGDAASPFRLRGQYHDAETGLYYNYSRHYDPGLGDYTAPDPIGIEGGYNLYAYPRNPLRWHDPYGLECDIPANHPPEDDPKTSTRSPPNPVPPIAGAPQPLARDIAGGKHAPDRTTAEVAALAMAPGRVVDPATGKYVPATLGPDGRWVPAQPGDPPVYTPQGQWNSVDAAQRAAAQHDPAGPRVQTVPIGENDGTVTRPVSSYPVEPGAPTRTVTGTDGRPVQAQAQPTPERQPADRAVTVRQDDGSIHTFPIPPDHQNYNDPPAGGAPPTVPPAGGAPPAGGGGAP